MSEGPITLRAVGYQNDDYFVRFHDYCWDLKCPKPGSSVDLLLLTSEVMNATLELIRKDADVDVTLEMIANGTADISLEDLRITTARMNIVDFSAPTNFMHFGYLLKEIPEIQVEDYILASFDVDVVLLLIVFGISVGLLAYFTTRLILHQRNTMFQWVFESCISLLRQFQFYTHGPLSTFILITFWMFSCMIVTTFYEAKLKSFLTLSHARGTIFTDMDGVLDAVEKKDWTMVIQERGYNPKEYANPAQLKRLQKLPNHKVIRIGENDDYLSYLTKERHVGFGAYSADMNRYPIVNIITKKKIIFVRDELIAPEYLGYAIRKNSPRLREQLNRALTQTTIGYNNLRGRYFAPYLEYTSSRYQPTRNLTLTHFKVLFKSWLIFTTISLFALIGEHVYIRFGPTCIHFLHNRIGLFRYKLCITEKEKNHFHRKHLIILPIKRTASPVNEVYGRFHIIDR